MGQIEIGDKVRDKKAGITGKVVGKRKTHEEEGWVVRNDKDGEELFYTTRKESFFGTDRLEKVKSG
jgi:hypothetical protein